MVHVIVFSTCARKKEATKIAQRVLQERLAACVSILPVTSFYWWKNKINRGQEYLLIIKTRADAFRRLQRRICEISSYEVPEIVSVKINDGLPSYLRWLDKETHANPCASRNA
jgi:periplasmic divalent cation tolerance protein